MKQRIPFVLAIAVTAVLVQGCGTGEPDSSNTAVPAGDAIPSRALAFVDSIGVELGDSNYVFGSIEAVSHTAGGNLLVLDRPACSVKEYTPEGDFVRSLGRRGSGPGEFINPLSMTRLTDGRIAVLDQQTGGLHLFSPEGEWLGVSAEITDEPILWITPAEGDRYVGTRNSFEVVDDQMQVTAVVGRYSADSTEADRIYWENTFPFDFRDFSVLVEEAYFATTWTSDREGNVFIASRNPEEYLVTGYDPDGAPFVEISMDLPTVEKTPEELAAEGAFWSERARNMGAYVPEDFTMDPLRWQVHSMGVDGEQRLWVRRGTMEIPTFDVFDYSGERLFTASLPAVTGVQGLMWEVKVDDQGILAWSLDPEDGYQKLYVVEMSDL
jgi:hypothetical protein